MSDHGLIIADHDVVVYSVLVLGRLCNRVPVHGHLSNILYRVLRTFLDLEIHDCPRFQQIPSTLTSPVFMLIDPVT